jgi:hypothetical protein
MARVMRYFKERGEFWGPLLGILVLAIFFGLIAGVIGSLWGTGLVFFCWASGIAIVPLSLAWCLLWWVYFN